MLKTSELDNLLRVTIAEGGLPGVVAAVTDRREPIYQGSAGARVLGSDAPMDPSALCHIASMTKPITAAAVLLLVEQGKLNLDGPAGEIIPHFYQARVLTGFDHNGAAQTREPARPITLHQLLTHTAGIANETWSADTEPRAAFASAPLDDLRRLKMPDLSALAGTRDKRQFETS